MLFLGIWVFWFYFESLGNAQNKLMGMYENLNEIYIKIGNFSLKCYLQGMAILFRPQCVQIHKLLWNKCCPEAPYGTIGPDR